MIEKGHDSGEEKRKKNDKDINQCIRLAKVGGPKISGGIPAKEEVNREDYVEDIEDDPNGDVRVRANADNIGRRDGREIVERVQGNQQ